MSASCKAYLDSSLRAITFVLLRPVTDLALGRWRKEVKVEGKFQGQQHLRDN